jgi:hypothetical protein
VAEDAITAPAPPSAPPTPIDRGPFDYSDLAHWMIQLEQTIRHVRRTLTLPASGSAESEPDG